MCLVYGQSYKITSPAPKDTFGVFGDMWYTTCGLNSVSTSSTPVCRQCNSPLIFVEKKTVKLENSHFETTTTIYKCSNKECQDEIDKKSQQRKKLAADQAEAREKRAKANLEQRQQKKSSIQA